MKVWIVKMQCGSCGDSEWGGVFATEEKAREKEAEMIKDYTDSHHADRIDCDDYEVIE